MGVKRKKELEEVKAIRGQSHAQEVPGTKVMTEKKYLIKYDILEMNNGSPTYYKRQRVN